MSLMTSSMTISTKSLSWKSGEGTNVGDGASSVPTRMSATLRRKKRVRSSAVKQKLVEDLEFPKRWSMDDHSWRGLPVSLLIFAVQNLNW